MGDLYELHRRDLIHHRSPWNRGELASPPAHQGRGVQSPLCGDEVVVSILGRGRHR